MRKERAPMSEAQKRKISENMKRFWADNPHHKKAPAASGAGVYVLRERGTNFVKIGTTTKFQGRYVTMRRPDNPRALVFLGWLSRDPWDETRFHKEFSCRAATCGGGKEWFLLSDEELEGLENRLLR